MKIFSMATSEETKLSPKELCDTIDIKVDDLKKAYTELTNNLTKGLNNMPYTLNAITDTYNKFIEDTKKVYSDFEAITGLAVELEKLGLKKDEDVFCYDDILTGKKQFYYF